MKILKRLISGILLAATVLSLCPAVFARERAAEEEKKLALREGYYTMQTGDGRYLSFASGSFSDKKQGKLVLSDTPQKLSLISDNQGSYTISVNGMCLDAFQNSKGYTDIAGAYAMQSSSGGSKNQRWKFVENSDGSLSLIAGNGTALDFGGYNEANGTLKLAEPTGGSTQSWILTAGQTVDYNSATLYDYSTAFYVAESYNKIYRVHNTALQEGKSEYNRDLAKQIGMVDIDNQWRGMFFQYGAATDTLCPQTETVDLTEAQVSAQGRVDPAKLTDGDLNTVAWSTGESTQGTLTIQGLGLRGLQEVEATFVNKDGAGLPETVRLTLVSGGKAYDFIQEVSGGSAASCTVTFPDVSGFAWVTEARLTVTSGAGACLTELALKGDEVTMGLKDSALTPEPSQIIQDGELLQPSGLTDGDNQTQAWKTSGGEGTLTLKDLKLNGLRSVTVSLCPPEGDRVYPDAATLTVTNNGRRVTATGTLSQGRLIFAELNLTGSITEMELYVSTEAQGKYVGISEIQSQCYVLARGIQAAGISALTASGEEQPDKAGLFDGDYATAACAVTADAQGQRWLDISLPQNRVFSEINVYLLGEDMTADQITLLDDLHTNSSGHTAFPADRLTKLSREGQTLWKVTLQMHNSWRVADYFPLKSLSLGFTKDVEIAEIQVVTRDDTFSSPENVWTGSKKLPLEGLVEQSLDENGELRFTVPEAGLFTDDTENKTVYHDVHVPFLYDPATGYHTFSTDVPEYDSSKTTPEEFRENDGYDVHFKDLNGNGYLDPEECTDGAYLLMDYQRYYPSQATQHRPGFFPFNVANGSYANASSGAYPFYSQTSTPAAYHFGMDMEIPFYMTADGTTTGNGGDPLRFCFAGDDDVWVYIDGQLVLDIGGIHDSLTGTIDFSANQAVVQNGKTVKLFNDQEGEGVLGKTLADFARESGSHVMNIYYMERGEGESNCHISYNMLQFPAVMGETNVIDYGLPVKLDIMANDFNSIGQHEFTIASLSAPKYGKVRVLNREGQEVSPEDYSQIPDYYLLEYTPTTYLSQIETISYTYGDETSNEEEELSLSAAVQVVPATTMYYEENFQDAQGQDYITTTNGRPGYAGYEALGIPGEPYQESGVVGTLWDSTYGTDAAYLLDSGDSHGTSYHFDTSDYGGAFKYTFTGTGTAIYARTMKTSAYIRISIKDSAGKNYFTTERGYSSPYVYVDTKYNGEGTLYNIPVYHIEGMEHGTYSVTVSISKPNNEADWCWYKGQTDFYLDGIRVYNPMGADPEANEIYALDGEENPDYITLRDTILTGNVSKEGVDLTGGKISASGSLEADKVTDGSLGEKAWQVKASGTLTLTPAAAISDLYSVDAYFIGETVPEQAKLICRTEGGQEVTTYGFIAPEQNDGTETLYRVSFLPLTTEPVEELRLQVQAREGLLTMTELKACTADWANQEGGFAVFTDGAASGETGSLITTVKEYTGFGPKQEVYLNEGFSSGQKLGFLLEDWAKAQARGAKLYLGMKIPMGQKATVTVNQTPYEISNTTDCYYEITQAVGANGEVVIGTDGFVSLTVLKGIDYTVRLAGGASGKKLLFEAMKINEEPEHEHSFTQERRVEPDCTRPGYVYGVCSCGEEILLEEIAALGHDYRDGFCQRCGAAQPQEEPDLPQPPDEPTVPRFEDVPKEAWYASAVDYALGQGLMEGVGGNRFDPDGTMTRAMVVTVLWRHQGRPEAQAGSFADVPQGLWYSQAVSWAAEQGIVKGVDADHFDPDGPITREQIGTILFRYARFCGSTTEKRGNLEDFQDGFRVSDYAREAMEWAAAEGIFRGDQGLLCPGEKATRAQVSALLMRMFQKVFQS